MTDESRDWTREEVLQRQRERERWRNETEAREIDYEMRQFGSAGLGPQDTHQRPAHVQSYGRQGQPGRVTSPGHLPHASLPEHPIRREIPNPKTEWSRTVTSSTPWGDRSRRQLAITTLAPSSPDEEDEMLRQALALSMQTMEDDSVRRQQRWDAMRQTEVDARVKDAAAATWREPQHGKSDQSARHREQAQPIKTFPSSDKFGLYSGSDGAMTAIGGVRDIPPTRRTAQPPRRRSNNDGWSVCPGAPSQSDWSCARQPGDDPDRHTPTQSQASAVCAEEMSDGEDVLEVGSNSYNAFSGGTPTGRGASSETKTVGGRLEEGRKVAATGGSDDWDRDCRWETEGPSVPGQKSSKGLEPQRTQSASAQVRDSKDAEVVSAVERSVAGKSAESRREAETNTEPLVPPPPLPLIQKHDSFTQTKLATGFVGSYWDAASKNTARSPAASRSESSPAPHLMSQIPEDGRIPSSIPAGPRSDRRRAVAQTDKKTTLGASQDARKVTSAPSSENWDDNLIETFAEISVGSGSAARMESSIAVSTGHESSNVPRLPAGPPTSAGQRRMMTDDQKLNDQHLQNRTDANNSNHGNTSGHAPSDRPISGHAPSDHPISGHAPTDHAPTDGPSGLPSGLPPHLVQAYLHYVAQGDRNNSSTTTGATPANPPPGDRNNSASAPIPGFIPPMWSPIVPWMAPMMPGPMMPHPMMPMYPPVMTYSMQQQRKVQRGNEPVDATRPPQMASQAPPPAADGRYAGNVNPSGDAQNDSWGRQSDVSSVTAHASQVSGGTESHPQAGPSAPGQAPGQAPGRGEAEAKDCVDWPEDRTDMAAGEGLHGGRTACPHSGQYHSQKYFQPKIPRLERQRRLELNRKIQTFIKEIKKDTDDYGDTEVLDEEKRISS